jgi:hypothetical protein
MLEIHLYGKLRKYAQGASPGGGATLTLEPDPGETTESLLARLGIPALEINHIFYNANLLASRSRTALLYGLPQSGAGVSDWDLSVPVDHGDRIGLFGLDIPVLSM